MTDVVRKTESQDHAGIERTSELDHKLTLVVFSGDFDRLCAALSVATSAAAMGVQVSLFFNFWGLLAIRTKRLYKQKPLLERLLTLALPKGPGATSRMNFFGIGPRFFGILMRRKNVTSVSELMDVAQQLGVRFVACQTSMDVMGVTLEELPDGIEVGGAAGCVQNVLGGSAMFV